MLLARLLTLSHVPRWVIIDTSKPQTVADHSFRVAAICLVIVNELLDIGVTISRETVLIKAITHDMEEAVSGDIPTPYKKRLANWGFTDHDKEESIEAAVVKVADLLEAVSFVGRYVVRPDKIRPGLVTDLKKATDDLHGFTPTVPRGWLNRIIDKIQHTGATYE